MTDAHVKMKNRGGRCNYERLVFDVFVDRILVIVLVVRLNRERDQRSSNDSKKELDLRVTTAKESSHVCGGCGCGRGGF